MLHNDAILRFKEANHRYPSSLDELLNRRFAERTTEAMIIFMIKSESDYGYTYNYTLKDNNYILTARPTKPGLTGKESFIVDSKTGMNLMVPDDDLDGLLNHIRPTD